MSAPEPVAAGTAETAGGESTTAGAGTRTKGHRAPRSLRGRVRATPTPPPPTRAVVRVNLLPPEVRAGRQGHRVRRLVVAGLAVTALLLGGVSYVARTAVGDARDELAATEVQSAALRSQQSRFAGVVTLQQTLATATARFGEVARGDLAWAPVLAGVAAATPPGVVVDGIDGTALVADATAGAAPVVATAAGTPAAAGGLTVTGTATSPVTVAAFVDALESVAGLSGVVATGVSAVPGRGFSFGIAAVVTTDALRVVPGSGPVK